MTSTLRGVPSKADIVSNLSKGSCVNLWTRGVQKIRNFLWTPYMEAPLSVKLNLDLVPYLNEVALVERPLAAVHELRALLFADVDVPHDLLELVPVDLRALLGILPRVADRPLLRPLDGALHELVVDGVFDHDARTGGTALALRVNYLYESEHGIIARISTSHNM